jgi:hypothetical protein
MPFKVRKIKKKRKPTEKKHSPLIKGVRGICAKLSPKTLKTLKVVGICGLTVVLMALVYFGQQTGSWFKASILDMPQPFNGTVMPVSKVPNFTYWSTQKTLTYDQIPTDQLIDLPPYDLTKMQFPDSQLVWGNASQDSIRNAKITYPVVYLGDYKFDHKENAGSHLAVDIKMPIGTPIHTIANGKVVTVSMDSGGFGHHVVIKMINVPDPANPGSTTTLYACFDHMDRIDVTEGQNVLKGQIIGTSGNTGTSTTPHLHFQIDNANAPWHPYWPFTSQDEQKAGLSFFESVDAGLGIDKARANTVNPMTFVTQNINYSAVASANDVSTPTPNTTTPPDTTTAATTTPADTTTAAQPDTTTTQQAQPDPNSIPQDPQPAFTDTGAANLFTYNITGEQVAMVGSAINLVVTDTSNQIASLSDTDTIRVDLAGVGQLLKKQFTKADFVNNTLKVIVKSDVVGISNITIGKSSYQVSFIDQLKPVSKFHIEHDGFYQQNVVELVKIIALDEDGNMAPAVNFSGVVNITASQDGVKIIPDQIQASDFKSGVATVKVVIPSTDPVVIKAQDGALVGESEPLVMEDKKVFSDITILNPNYDAIKYLKDNNIINGYADGSFKPNNTVNRAEALKMLMLAFNVSVSAGGTSDANFKDVDKSAWYAQAISAGVAKGIVKGYSDGTFKPASTVNRVEYLKILFATNNITPSTDITKPYDDVSLNDWFAGYAYLANKMNILDTGKDLNPGGGMTRADVAETIYRMKMIQTKNMVTYSK